MYIEYTFQLFCKTQNSPKKPQINTKNKNKDVFIIANIPDHPRLNLLHVIQETRDLHEMVLTYVCV